MAHVSCRMFEMYERGAAELGVPAAQLLEGTQLSLAMVRDKRARAPWDEWVVVCANFEAAIGGPDAMRTWGYRIIDHDYMSTFRRLAGGLLTPANLYRTAIVWMAPLLYPHLTFSVHVDRVRVRIVIEIPDELCAGEAWFRLVEGTLVVLPRLLGQPDATVEANIAPRRAVYDVTLPSRGARLAWVRTLGRMLLRPSSLVEPLAAAQRDVDDTYRAALQSEHEVRTLLHELPDPVVIVSDGRVVQTNQAWRDVFAGEGCTFDADRPFSDYFVPGQRALAEDILLGASNLRELLMSRYDGTLVVVEPSVSSTLRFRGRSARALVVRDVTRLREQEAILATAERVAVQGTMAAGVAHDINNPLAAVLGSLELLERALSQLAAGAPRSEALALARTARANAQRVSDIAADLTQLAHVHDDAVDVAHLEGVCDAVARLARNEIRHRAVLVKDYQNAPAVALSPTRSSQVLLNILIHVAQAIPPGCADQNHMTLRTRGTRARGVDEAVVEVTVDGPGVGNGRLRDLFGPLHPEDASTTWAHAGLGLTITQRIVEECGGRLEFETTPEAGSTFRVTLPASDAAAPAPLPTSTAKSRPGDSPRRILVVDDEPTLRKIISRMLRAHDVECAASGQEALELLARDPARDVIFCDVMMPDLTGIDVLARVAVAHPELAARIVFITGGAFDEATRRSLTALPNLRIFKPFVIADLEDAVQRVANLAATVSNHG